MGVPTCTNALSLKDGSLQIGWGDARLGAPRVSCICGSMRASTALRSWDLGSSVGKGAPFLRTPCAAPPAPLAHSSRTVLPCALHEALLTPSVLSEINEMTAPKPRCIVLAGRPGLRTRSPNPRSSPGFVKGE